MHPKNGPKTINNRSKNDPKSIQNGPEIDGKMMIGCKIAFWKHLGHLGGHVDTPKGGWVFPSCEQRTGKTPPGRGRGGVNPSLEGTGRVRG